MLEVKLEVVSRNGVRFFDCNATRADARQSTNPSIVRFDVVRAKKQGDVEKDLQRFYQAEVLVPSPIPPHLIMFPKKTAAQMKAVKTRANDECTDKAAPRCEVSADSIRENVENAVNKARSVSGRAKPLPERKSGEFCVSMSGGPSPELETGPRSESTGKKILSDLGDGSGSLSVDDGCLSLGSNLLRSCNSLPRISLDDSKCLGMPQACVLATGGQVVVSEVDKMVGASASFDEVHSDLIAVGRRLLPNFIAWLVSTVSFCFFDLMVFLNIVLADCLRQELCSLPVRQRMQMCRSLQLWYSMNCPPPLPVNDSRDKCEFGAVPCDSASMSETTCCASRRCAEHSKRNYVCSCWIALTNVKRMPRPEPRMKVEDVVEGRCGVPVRALNPKCADCREGLIICKHRGECGRIAFTACPGCFRFVCEKCLAFVCCGYVSARVVPKPTADKFAPLESKSIESESPTTMVDYSRYRADTAVTVSSLFLRAIALLFLPQTIKVDGASYGPSPQSVPVDIAPVASYPVETKLASARPMESGRVNIVSAPSASGAMNDQVELLPHRNHVRMNVCHRYAYLAGLCRVFGIEKQVNKKARQGKQSKLTTNTKDRSVAPTPSSKDSSQPSSPSSSPPPISSLLSADARYKPKLLHGGRARATDAQKITPGQPLLS